MSDIVLQGLSRAFGAFVAVDNIDLEVATGEFVTLLGPSGCGKTTTLRMIAGLEQNTGGRILIGGDVVSDAERRVFVPPERRNLGMVFQSYAIWPHMTVFENVAYPLRIRRRPAAEVRDRVHRALSLVEMDAFADRPAPALSGGQQQRVAIARALVFEPRVLLLDEPLSNLDARLRNQTGDEFRALQKRLGITSVYVTHDQSEAMSLSDRVVVMQSGRILQVGTPEDVYQRPRTRAVADFFGMPNLLDALVRRSSRDASGQVEIAFAGQGFSGSCHGPREMPEGSRIVVLLRPESLTVRSGDNVDPAKMQWRGEVVESIFRGGTRSLLVRTASGDLRVEANALVSPALGANVTLEADPRAVWVLAS